MKITKLIKWTAIATLVIYLLPDGEDEENELRNKFDYLNNKFKKIVNKSKSSLSPDIQKQVDSTLDSVGQLFQNINFNNLRHSLAQCLTKTAKYIDILEKDINKSKNQISKNTNKKAKIINPEVVARRTITTTVRATKIKTNSRKR